MSRGELVFASVVDQRLWDAQGQAAPSGIYVLGVPGTALTFTIARSWKVPNGTVAEELRLIGPSGKTVWTWGPFARRMKGTMDLTVELDRIEAATLEETGTHLMSFIIDGEIVGELEVPVHLQQAPAKLSKTTEDGVRKSDVIWVGVERGGSRQMAPIWFAYKNGRIYVVSQRESGPQEQTIPGVPGSPEVLVVTRRKGRDTSLEEFPAAVRLLEGTEWEDAAKILVDRRRSRVGAPGESIDRWRSTCEIAELTPIIPA
jgi:hypothetical protein